MLPQRHNQQLFSWLLRRVVGGASRVRGEVDAASGAVKFDGRNIVGPSWLRHRPKFTRGTKRQVTP